jgi:hypothetical protein
MFRYFAPRWLRTAFTGLASEKAFTRRHRRPQKLTVERLEQRLAPATLTEPNGTTLLITLDNANEALTVVSNGTTYSFGSSNNFVDGGVSNAGDFTGFGTTALALNASGLARYSLIRVEDSAAGASVAFNDSGLNAYSDAFQVALDGGSAGVAFNGASIFGANALSVQTDRNITVNGGATVSTSDGGITLEGNLQAVPTAGNFQGVRSLGTVTSTGSGNLDLRGRAGDDAATGFHVGVNVLGGVVSSAGTGKITIVGTGGSGTVQNFGVKVEGTNARITSVSGAIDIIGTAGAGTGLGAAGVLTFNGGKITSTGTGATAATITINGTGADGTALNDGFRADAPGSAVETVDGAVSITATAGANSSAIALANGGALTSTGAGGFTLAGDSMDLAGGTIAAGTNLVTLKQKTNGTAIDLGGADGAGTLGLTAAELGNITAGTLAIGDATSGAITVSAAIDVSAKVNTLALRTGAAVVDGNATGTDLTVGKLSLAAATGIGSGDPLEVNVSTLAASNDTSGGVAVTDPDGFTVDTVGSVAGVTANGQAVALTATAGGIDVDSPISATGPGGSVSLDAGQFVFVDANVTGGGAGVSIIGRGLAAVVSAGVVVLDRVVTTTDGGAVTVTGTGGGLGGAGVVVTQTGTAITSGGGPVSVTGTGGAGSDSPGVQVDTGGAITAGGTGTVTVVGTGGSGAGVSNYGVLADTINARITSGGGAVSVTATGTGTRAAVRVDDGAITSGGDAAITVTADSVDLNTDPFNPGVISAGTGGVTLKPRTAGTLIDLGGADVLSGSPLTLGLSGAELGQVTAGTLVIGDAQSGSITVSAAIDVSPTVGTLALRTGAAVVDGNATGTDLTVGKLSLAAATGIGSGDPLETAVSTLAASNATSGSVEISNAGALAIGTVGGTVGVANTGGAVVVAAASPLTVAADVAAAGDMTLTATDSAAAGDDLKVLAGVTVSSTGGGNILLQAGDDATIDATAVVQTSGAGTITLCVDFGNADPGVGATATLSGASFSAAAGVAVKGNADADTFIILGGTGIAVDGAAGSDTLDLTGLGTSVIQLTAQAAGGDGFNGNNGAGITFTNINAIHAAGASTLAGIDAAALWAIRSANSGRYTVGPNTLDFTGFPNLTGGSGADAFAFFDVGAMLGSVDGNITGGGGTDTLDYSALAVAVSTDLATGKSSRIGGVFSGIENFLGSRFTTDCNMFGGPNADSTWVLSGANSGTVGGVAFADYQSLTGGTGADTFKFTEAGPAVYGHVDCDIDGGGGTDKLDYSVVTRAVVAAMDSNTSGTSLRIGGRFLNMEGVIGTALSDLLIGPNAANLWAVNGANAGNVNGFTFTNVESLHGGTGADTFKFVDAGPLAGGVTGSIDGGSGADTLDYSMINTAGATNLETGTTPRVGMFFTNVEALVGSPLGHTLTGKNVPNLWLISGANAGTVNGFAFTNVPSLVGGTDRDRFELLAAGSAATIDGAAGTDTLVGKDAVNTWTINAINAGTVNSVAFANVENLTGGASTDDFRFLAGGGITGNLDGGLGVDTLNYSTRATAVLTDLQAGTTTDVGGTSQSVEVLLGGTSTANRLTGQNNANVWAIDGGDDGNVDGFRFVDVPNLTGGTASDRFVLAAGGSVSGAIDGGGGDDTLVGFDTANTWTISGLGAGSLTAAPAGSVGSFANVENLTGGADDDAFAFLAGGGITGNLDGGLGVDTLDYSTRTTTVRTNLQTAKTTDVGGTFHNVEALIGGTATDNQLTGQDNANVWAVGGADSGDVDGFRFTNVPNLTGGSAADRFVLGAAGSVSGTIDGMGGSDTLVGSDGANVWVIDGADKGSFNSTPFISVENLVGGASTDDFQFKDGGSLSGSLDGRLGDDTLDYTNMTAPSTTDLQGAHSTGIMIGTFANVEAVLGPAGLANVLIGQNNANVWSIDGADSGDVDGFRFTNVPNLTGGSAADRFVLGTAGSVSGTIDGMGGSDTLVGADFDTVWKIDGAGMGVLQGNAGMGVLQGGRFLGIENLAGGAQADDFQFMDGGSIAGNLDGGRGDDTLDYTQLTTASTTNLQTAHSTGVLIGTFAGVESLVGPAGRNSVLVGQDNANVWSITGTDAGDVNGFRFANTPNLTGGMDRDVFRFFPGGRLIGAIDGGASPAARAQSNDNWLDYHNTSTSVHVRLFTLTRNAPLTSGVTNIDNVIGSAAGGDWLEGNGNANILVAFRRGNRLEGRVGFDLLIGGQMLLGQPNLPKNLLIGGAGQDVIIPGSTIYDTNPDALDKLRQEWLADRRTGRPAGLSLIDDHDIRAINLLTGGGLTGGNKLALNTTVFLNSVVPGPAPVPLSFLSFEQSTVFGGNEQTARVPRPDAEFDFVFAGFAAVIKDINNTGLDHERWDRFKKFYS